MKNATKIAGFGLAAGAAMMLALSTPALARGPQGADGSRLGLMPGGPTGGLFTLQFADLDVDGDGKITEAELKARAEALVAARLAEVDGDGDGTVTVDELKARILAGIEARAGGRALGARAADPATMASTMAERMIAARDSDDDGALSGEELSPVFDIAALIDRFDTDDDNAWSKAEFDASRIAGRRDGMRGGRSDRGARMSHEDGWGPQGGQAPFMRR